MRLCKMRFRKIALFYFGQSELSASVLTCRRHAADTPQTLTQTLTQTLIEQEDRREAFLSRCGEIIPARNLTAVRPFICNF
jgi:hypothetical protein